MLILFLKVKESIRVHSLSPTDGPLYVACISSCVSQLIPFCERCEGMSILGPVLKTTFKIFPVVFFSLPSQYNSSFLISPQKVSSNAKASAIPTPHACSPVLGCTHKATAEQTTKETTFGHPSEEK